MSTQIYSPTSMTKERVQKNPPSSVDVAIVGAGTGGLMAGAYLARQGLKVALFDPHYVAGGCATQFARGSKHNRYLFDVGLHYLGDCAPGGHVYKLLDGLGLNDSIQFAPLDPDGFDTLIFPDFTFRIPAGHEQYRARLHEQFPQEQRGIDRYMRYVNEFDALNARIFATQDRVTPGLLPHILLRARTIIRHQKHTLAQVLDLCTQNPQLRAVIAAQHGDYGLPPSQVSSILHVGLSNHFLRGAYYPKGGGQVISDQLADTIEAAGGSIHLRLGIEKILVEKGRAVGVRTEPRKGHSYDVRARVVLSNADIQRTLTELIGVEHLPGRWVRKSRNMTMAQSLFITCLGLDVDLKDKGMKASNYWQFDDYDTERIYQAQDPQHITPRMAYISSSTAKDPDSTKHAPPGHSCVEIITPVPGGHQLWQVEQGDIESWSYKRNDQYNEIKQRFEDDLIERFERQFPGTRQHIVFQESATPISQSRYTRSTNGSGYGLAATPAQFLNDRPGHVGPLKDLYLCGHSCRAGHGVLGAMYSGYIAALNISRKLKQPITPLK